MLQEHDNEEAHSRTRQPVDPGIPCPDDLPDSGRVLKDQRLVLIVDAAERAVIMSTNANGVLTRFASRRSRIRTLTSFATVEKIAQLPSASWPSISSRRRLTVFRP
jgi:hypothetical protein